MVVVGVLISLTTLISAFLSTSVQKSLIGQGFELGGASFLIVMFIAMLLVVRLIINNKDRIFSLYGSFALSFSLLALFQISRLLLSPSFMSFGIFNYSTATLLGRWSDLGILSAVLFLLSFFVLNILSVKKSIKILTYMMFIVSGMLVFIVNSALIWMVLSLVFLSYYIYLYIKNSSSSMGFSRMINKVSVFALIFFIISGVLALNGSKVASVLKPFNFEQTEISLPWQLALDVTADTIKERPLFGAGPNRFASEFLKYKPAALNPSIFWSAEFNTGFGFIPSFAVTNGVVGIVLWILFLIFFFILGVKGLRKVQEPLSRFIVASTFFTSSFLWLISLLYSPSHVIILLTFIMTGIFLGALCLENVIENKEYKIDAGSKTKTVVTLVSIILIIAIALWLLVYIKKVIALKSFQGAVSTLNKSANKEIEKAEVGIRSALAWDKSDMYYRAISEIDMMKISPILQTLQAQSEKDPKTIDQELLKQVNNLIQDAASSTLSAISVDPTNYYNYVANARVNELANSLKIDGAYENAKTAYSKALQYNPYSPLLYLNVAQLEASMEKADEAQKYIGAALQLKQNYTEAIYLLSQIQVAQGKIKDAIISAQVMAQINPNNSMIFFQLGYLYFSDKDYVKATEALGKAVELNGQYANARYFLGLSLARLKKYNEAVIQFEEILKTNPENQEIVSIIASLKAGKSPFTDEKTDKSKTLPVKDKTTTNTKKIN